MAEKKGQRPIVPARVATDGVAVTPSDGTDLPDGPTIKLGISVAGALKVDMADGSTLVIPNIPAGIWDLAVRRVWQNGTAATGITAFY